MSGWPMSRHTRRYQGSIHPEKAEELAKDIAMEIKERLDDYCEDDEGAV